MNEDMMTEAERASKLAEPTTGDTATLVGQIFREADYEVKSRFFESAFFRSLYMSGAY